MAEKLTLEKLVDLGKMPTAKVQELAQSSRVYDDFKSEIACCKALGAGAATGTAGDENILITDNQILRYHVIGTQTIVAPSLHANGLNISQDLTADDGVEYAPSLVARGKQVFTVGTDAAFYARCRISIADVSGTDDLAFGFRKVEAFQAAIDNYDEMAALNLISGDIYIETILNAAATVSTDTTDNVADAAVIDLYVEVSAAGVVTFKHGLNQSLAAPTTTAAFTFDDGEVVMPFLYLKHDTDVAETTCLQLWECGLVAEA